RGGRGREGHGRSRRELLPVREARHSGIRVARRHLQLHHGRRRAVDERAALSVATALSQRRAAAVVGMESGRHRRMAGTERQRRVKPARGALVAVDGVDAAEIVAAARAKIAGVPRARRGGVSPWDAAGVFDDVVVVGAAAGAHSARTLILLYAADLAFRLRWEIKPAIAEGRVVVAAPYVATAIAFGRAAGLPPGWLRDLFSFAPRPAEA